MSGNVVRARGGPGGQDRPRRLEPTFGAALGQSVDVWLSQKFLGELEAFKNDHNCARSLELEVEFWWK